MPDISSHQVLPGSQSSQLPRPRGDPAATPRDVTASKMSCRASWEWVLVADPRSGLMRQDPGPVHTPTGSANLHTKGLAGPLSWNKGPCASDPVAQASPDSIPNTKAQPHTRPGEWENSHRPEPTPTQPPTLGQLPFVPPGCQAVLPALYLAGLLLCDLLAATFFLLLFLAFRAALFL